MKEMIEKIHSLTEPQLRQLMESIQERYRNAYPQYDILYIVLHKDPALREQELMNILSIISSSIQYQEEQLFSKRLSLLVPDVFA